MTLPSSPQPTDLPSISPPAEPLLILVAEDEESVRTMVGLVLDSRGYRSLLCEDGRAALDQLEAGAAVDAVLMDIRMPRLGGLELVQAIRARPEWEQLPVVAMSAYNDELQARAVLAAGADAFLAKPFTVQDLSATLDSLLAGE
ncbi:MAG: response regulator [Dehalococcoidia bacterium]|nr:response regulator [Dehalococcoidia bacterium]